MILVELYLVVAIMIFAIMMMFLLCVRKEIELKWWMLLLATIACGIASFLWILCFFIFIIAILHTELWEHINKD